jgi:hypothetical protein
MYREALISRVMFTNSQRAFHYAREKVCVIMGRTRLYARGERSLCARERA